MVSTIITCVVFTWIAESDWGQLLGLVALITSLVVVGENIVRRLNTK
ncbi:MAG: hypothetical protein ABIN01_03845 [Ferruginibacter sp.]